MTVRDVLNYNEIIKSIIDDTKDVSALVKFRLLGMLKQFEDIVTNYEIVRAEKIQKYGKATENGGYGIIPPKKEKFENDEDFQKAFDEFRSLMDNFDAEMKEVTNSELENFKITKFKYSDIIDAGIPSEYLVAIYDLIEE